MRETPVGIPMLRRQKTEIDISLLSIFNELKDKKIIDPAIQLSTDKGTSNIQGLNFFNVVKRIRFNPYFYSHYLSTCDENTIRFVLLHEAGHISEFSWFRIENFLILSGVAMAFLIILISIFVTNFLFRLFGFTICFMVFLIFLRIFAQFFLDSLRNAEFDADHYAFIKFLDNYVVPDKCSFLEELFNILDSIMNDPRVNEIVYPSKVRRALVGSIIKLIGYEGGYHPENKERMDRLKKLANCPNYGNAPAGT